MKVIIACAGLGLLSVGIVLLLVNPDAGSNVAEKEAEIVRPSEQFAEIVARGWPRTAIGPPPHTPNPVSEGGIIIPNVNFEMSGFEGDGFDGPLRASFHFQESLDPNPDPEEEAKRPPALEPRGQMPGWLESETRFVLKK